MKKILLNELNTGDDIWFKSPYNSFSYWGEVKELHHNFEGKPYAIVQVGTKLYKIDERFTLCMD